MKLQTKLIIAFIAIVLLMGISQSFFLQSSIKSTFQSYLNQYNFGFMERMEQELELFYEETGSWENVQGLYFENSSMDGQGHGMMMRGMMMNMAMANADLLLIDMRGRVIADTAGTRIGMSGIDFTGNQKDVIVNGEKKGTLVLYQHELQNLEKEFLRSSNTAILISGLIVSVMAVLFSILIARKISNPLRILMNGIKRIACGEKVSEVNISTKDEFFELGTAFNEMSNKLLRNEEIRQALVADVAHELRTPLSILQGKLESIQEGAIQPSEEIVLELTDEVYRLNRLVSDLQQLSLAEAGKLPLHKQSVNVRQLVGRICSHLQWLADEKEITLRYDRIPNDFVLQIDADRMTQVLVNLIGNALRHTPNKGQVEVSGQENRDSFLLEISDFGQGIPGDALPFIFERFYKRDPSRTRNEGEGGTGLGLSIAKGFVEAHGGTINVESEVNKGTVFTIILPKEEFKEQ
ncbi:sensor histidine kinase [Neobacillus sp. LXY-4]|uniref:sensor histidine kinase n=1 Tax=Neobacillus sp. LXY-4 TaxID=3379826 RepID=UPI003EDF224B